MSPVQYCCCWRCFLQFCHNQTNFESFFLSKNFISPLFRADFSLDFSSNTQPGVSSVTQNTQQEVLEWTSSSYLCVSSCPRRARLINVPSRCIRLNPQFLHRGLSSVPCVKSPCNEKLAFGSGAVQFDNSWVLSPSLPASPRTLL